ncbi:MAG: ankyrin repeat domain-containing protein [Planctomycetota bacterium]|nr:MAG: ankyrin repeat domain-containing protein [Planctomycetota bacterium]
MKLSLPIKLGIFVVLLFAAVITTCLLWTPVKILWFGSKLKSDKPAERVAGVNGFLALGEPGEKELLKHLPGGEPALGYMKECWHDVSVDTYKSDNINPLYWAVLNGWTGVTGFLIDKGLDVNVIDNIRSHDYDGDGFSPLHLAAVYDRIDTAELLILRGAELNLRDAKGRTPLLVALWQNHGSFAKLLVGKGADVNAEDNNDFTPLYHALFHDNMEIAKILVAKGADFGELEDRTIRIRSTRRKNR